MEAIRRRWRWVTVALVVATTALLWFGFSRDRDREDSALAAVAGHKPLPELRAEPRQIPNPSVTERPPARMHITFDPNFKIPPGMEAALARKHAYDQSAAPAGRRIVSDLNEFKTIADPLEAMLTATSAEDAKWMEEYGWPLPEELRTTRDPDQACKQWDWSTLKDDSLCAHALFQRRTPADLERLTINARGSSFASRLRLLAELDRPRQARDDLVIRQAILTGILTGDPGIRGLIPGTAPLQFHPQEIISIQRAVASAADEARWGGNPIAFRPRPQPIFVVGVDAEGRSVAVPPPRP